MSIALAEREAAKAPVDGRRHAMLLPMLHTSEAQAA